MTEDPNDFEPVFEPLPEREYVLRLDDSRAAEDA